MLAEYDTVFIRSIDTHPSFATGSIDDLETTYYFVIPDGSVLQVTLDDDQSIITRLFSEGQRIDTLPLTAQEALTYVRCSPYDVVERVQSEYQFITSENERYITISLLADAAAEDVYGTSIVWILRGFTIIPETGKRNFTSFVLDPQECTILQQSDLGES
jgi:hypothetical protein